ncbi:Hypothetical protein D9617_2g057080 [Elsinoe fawcettii]|nr:Hypothetical protein D9617_2g057080 [Elsinoe fawcettii]
MYFSTSLLWVPFLLGITVSAGKDHSQHTCCSIYEGKWTRDDDLTALTCSIKKYSDIKATYAVNMGYCKEAGPKARIDGQDFEDQCRAQARALKYLSDSQIKGGYRAQC